MEEVNGFHKNYIDWQYLYNWTHGEARRLSNSSWWPRFRELISRYLIGYGAKPDRPMIAWLILNLVFSWLYLFSGIKYAENPIRREIGFDRTQVWNTLKDYCLCLYYSAITSTTVGYGDISPAPGVSMLICAVHAVLGLLLITMFTVIFARRFFKWAFCCINFRGYFSLPTSTLAGWASMEYERMKRKLWAERLALPCPLKPRKTVSSQPTQAPLGLQAAALVRLTQSKAVRVGGPAALALVVWSQRVIY